MTLPFGLKALPSWPAAGSALLLLGWAWTALPALQGNPIFVHQGLPLPLLIASLLLVGAHWRSVPLPGWLWLLAGAITLLWSLSLGFSLLSVQWDAVLLAALIAGRLLWRWPALPLSVAAAIGGWASLSTLATGGRYYLSGSVMYVAAALALPALGVFVALCLRQGGPRGWAGWLRWGAALTAVALLYLIGISASRAAYVPALLMLGALAWRSRKEGVSWRSLALVGLGLLGGVALLDALLFDHAVLQAVGFKALDSLHNAAREGGNLETRLQMWEVALHAWLTHPLGLGSGAYGDVFQSTQAWPIYYSRFAHNVFLETLAGGGLLRLSLLSWLLWTSWLSGWRSRRWPAALGLAGLWLNMCFDTTGNIPGTLLIAFLSAGLALGAAQPNTVSERAGEVWPALGAGLSALVVLGVALAWWWPQPAARQALWRGLWPPAVVGIPPGLRQPLLAQAVARFPGSVALQKQWTAAAPPAQQQQRLRAATRAIPYGDAAFYRRLAQVQRQAGDPAAAQTEALCLSRFGRARSPLGLPLSAGGIAGTSVRHLCLGSAP
ncbi:O-antigen ligase family protein [Deinococcus sp.]|uniref:O-antigen ligase family protein n=1 Tax=Deinococcus sp. TaxID=47478 RepID=UPI003CC5CBEE